MLLSPWTPIADLPRYVFLPCNGRRAETKNNAPATAFRRLVESPATCFPTRPRPLRSLPMSHRQQEPKSDFLLKELAMKTLFLLSATLLGAVSLASVAQTQDTSRQQDAQSASVSTSPTASPYSSSSPGNSGYGGVAGGTSTSGSLTNPRWSNCGHLPQCNPDNGH